MMFFFHSSLALSYIAMVFGCGLLIWSLRFQGEGKLFAKIIGALVFALSVTSVLSLLYHGARYWVVCEPEAALTLDLMKMQDMIQKQVNSQQ